MGDADGDPQGIVLPWEMGGRVRWIGLALSYFLALRASELFIGGNSVYHKVLCLQRDHVALVRDYERLEGGRRQEANKIEVDLRGSKEVKGGKGAVLEKARGGQGVCWRRCLACTMTDI